MKSEHVIFNLTLILMLILFWAGITNGATFSFENRSNDKKIFYLLYWWDHPFKSFGPVNLAGGELKPNQINRLQHDYPGHIFEISMGNPETGYKGAGIDIPGGHTNCVWDGEGILLE